MRVTGKFRPQFPQKYRGNVYDIVYRSSWELRVMKFLDTNPSIKWWSSEELIIPYYSPVDHKKHRYFPDFVVHVQTKNGTEKTFVLEVKPSEQCKLAPKKHTRKYLAEVVTYVTNQAKWQAANEFCLDHGWNFMVITEHDLGIVS